MRAAYRLARQLLPEHACKFSRHDFTLAQLFACLIVPDFFGLSYRRTRSAAISSGNDRQAALKLLRRFATDPLATRLFIRLTLAHNCRRT